MRIQNSQVAMSSKRTYMKETRNQSTGAVVFKPNSADFDLDSAKAAKDSESPDAQVNSRTSYNENGTQQVNSIAEIRLRLLEQILSGLRERKEQFRNKGINFSPASDLSRNSSGGLIFSSGYFVAQRVESSYYYEEEATAFSSTGKVMTEDGREIEFEIGFEMTRKYEEYCEVTYEESYLLCDPLVLSFSGNPSLLEGKKFMFDLDADGKLDEISSLSENCGFLALDKNRDGIINDGRELFGTQSGNGFKDLAAYDEDKNGWIDENDSIFEQLKIWRNGELISLAESGVGAICLHNAETKFNLNDPYDNAVNGVIQRSGTFLNEDGTAGIISHIDFAV